MTETSRPNRMAPWLEDAWMQRYLQRELAADEIDWFESYVLDKPDLVDALDRDSDLRDALARASDADWRGDNVVALAPKARKVWAAPLALAAALVLGLGVGRYAMAPTVAPGVEGDPARIFVDTLRGSSLEPVVDHAGSASRWVVVDLGVPAEARDITITRAGSAPVALTASADGVATLLLTRAELTATPVVVLRYRLGDRTETREIDLQGRLSP